jgi:predicted RNA-binding protein Jag
MTNKTKVKLKKFTNLQRQERRIEPMKPEETKYIQELLQRINNENIPTNSRGSLRPQHI